MLRPACVHETRKSETFCHLANAREKSVLLFPYSRTRCTIKKSAQRYSCCKNAFGNFITFHLPRITECHAERQAEKQLLSQGTNDTPGQRKRNVTATFMRSVLTRQVCCWPNKSRVNVTVKIGIDAFTAQKEEEASVTGDLRFI